MGRLSMQFTKFKSTTKCRLIRRIAPQNQRGPANESNCRSHQNDSRITEQTTNPLTAKIHSRRTKHRDGD